MKKVIILFVLLTTVCHSQIQPIAPDFLISGNDNLPSTIKQYFPRLYFTNSSNFITAWIDYREGEPLVYAQRFDANGNFIGNNLKTNSNAGVYLNEEGFILSLKTKSTPFFDDTNIYVTATLMNNSNQVIMEEIIYSTIIPWCGTGYISGEEIINASENDFYFLTNEGGYVALRKIESSGNYRPINIQFDDIHYVTRITSSATADGNYFFAWINGLQEDTLETGLYATFLDNQDSVIVSRLHIAELIDSGGLWEYVGNYNLQSLSLNDSTYKLFWMNKSSFRLYSIMLNTRGEIISDIDSIQVPVAAGFGYEPNVSITNLNDESFYLLISHRDENYNLYSNSFLKYDSEGVFVNILTEQTNNIFAQGIFNKGLDKFYRASTDNNDIYLDKLEYFTFLEANKINDDESGSNQINSTLTIYDNNTVFSTWHDEENNYGIKISKDGNIIGEKIPLDHANSLFFPNKESVSTWIKEDGSSNISVGYTIYDQEFNEKLSKTFFTTISSYIPYNLRLQIQIISDSTFIALLNNLDGLVLYKESLNGITLFEGTIISGQTIYSEKIFPVELNLPVESFWLYWDKKIQKFSSELVPQTDIINMPLAINNFLGDERFLNVHIEYDYLHINGIAYGTILTSGLDTIKSRLPLSYIKNGNYNLIIDRIDKNDFMAVNKYQDKYFARAYSNSGVILTDSFLVNTGSTSYTKGLNFKVNNDKVFFTWSDARNEGKGYDIYGNIFNLSSITYVKEITTGMPEKFYLYQNYPNPFNPTTKIIFSVPEFSHVIIKIYDILGNEISTLVDEKKQTGKYETEFNGNSLASGLYFYHINAGYYSETRKMILLK